MRNGLHGLRGLFGLPAIHTVWQRGDGGKISAVLGWYGRCRCSGSDLISASIFLKFPKNGLHGLGGLCGLSAIHTVWQRERGGRQDFRCVKLIWQLGMLWLWFILSQQFLKIFQEWSSRSAWSLWSTCNSHSVAEEGEGKTAAVLGWYGSCGFGCFLFSARIFLKFQINLCGLPAIHTVWQGEKVYAKLQLC